MHAAAEPTRLLGAGRRSGAVGSAGPPAAGGARPSRGRALRWLCGWAVVAAAAAVGFLAGLLVTIMVVAALLLVAIGLRLARENLPEGTRPTVPTWAFAVAAPVALGVGIAQLIGPIGGAAVVLGLVVLFLLLGGDIG